MEFDFTEDQRAIQDVAQRFAAERLAPGFMARDAGGPLDRDLLREMGGLGLIAAEIPEDIDWVLQVEGHTDDIPVRAGRFADNWDLSTERALSVVRFLATQGLPPNRLAAAGYGEFQPLDSAGGDEARRRNRRIEMKLTQRISGN